MTSAQSAWAHTAYTQPRPDDDALVACCVGLARLGIEDLVDEVRSQSGEREARRWRRARGTEFAARLLDALRRQLPTSELIVRVEEGDGVEQTRVVVSSADSPDPARREAELMDRVTAIQRRTWITWAEGLRATMGTLRAIGDPAPIELVETDAEKAA